MKLRPLAIETHVTHKCNLFCKGCVHYSDYGHKKEIDYDELILSMENWSNRISPQLFAILGGEPLIYKNLSSFILKSKEIWKESKLLLVSNGFLIKNHKDLPDALRKTNCRLDISIHDNSNEYLKKVEEIKDILKSDSWKNVEVRWRESYLSWYSPYKGYGNNMHPFNENKIKESWEICQSKKCTQLFEGKLWKCPAIAYLKMQDEKIKLHSDWHTYIKNYTPLDVNCSDDELKLFFEKKEEFICNMCPSTLQSKIIKNPLEKTKYLVSLL